MRSESVAVTGTWAETGRAPGNNSTAAAAMAAEAAYADFK
jgi:hypothetical protein